MKKTIVFDIDGVLSNSNDYKKWYDENNVFVPDKFEESILDFKVLEWGRELITALFNDGYYIALVTARRDKFRPKTVEWLRKNNIPYNFLHTSNEQLDSITYKVETLKQYDVLLVVEDNPEIVKACRDAGYTVLQPNNNYED